MIALTRRRLEMAARVREFLRAHPTEDAGDARAVARFEELLDRAEALAAQQHNGLVASRSATIRREQLRRALQLRLLPYLVSVGAVAARDRAELGAWFRRPGLGATHQAFLAAVRGMLAYAASRRDLLVSRGMSETLLDDLGATVAALEATLETSRAARRDHVGASADLKAVGGEILQQVRVLDGLVRYRFGNNAELMAAWKSARNVAGPAGPRTRAVRGEGEESPAEGGAGPAAPGRGPLRLLRLSP